MAQEAADNYSRQMYLEHAIKLMKKKREGKQAMKYKHILFDLDGTLINTEEAVLNTWQYTLKKYHYTYSLEELKSILGITTRKALEALKVTVDNKFEQNWIKNYANFAVKADFFPGIKKMLLELKAQGCSLGIVTSRCRAEYDAYFSSFHLEEIFHRIVCADDTKKHKPEPDPILKYTEAEKALLSSCIYIGDMPTDIECAKKAGIAAVSASDAIMLGFFRPGLPFSSLSCRAGHLCLKPVYYGSGTGYNRTCGSILGKRGPEYCGEDSIYCSALYFNYIPAVFCRFFIFPHKLNENPDKRLCSNSKRYIISANCRFFLCAYRYFTDIFLYYEKQRENPKKYCNRFFCHDFKHFSKCSSDFRPWEFSKTWYSGCRYCYCIILLASAFMGYSRSIQKGQH